MAAICGFISTDLLKDVIPPENITYPVTILELLDKVYQIDGLIGLMACYLNKNCIKDCLNNPLMLSKSMYQLTVSRKL